MRFSKLLSRFIFSLIFSAFTWSAAPSAFAVEGVSATELQAAMGIILPNGDGLGQLEGYSTFHLSSKKTVTGGISALYEAYLSDDPWLTDELPQIQLLVYAYNSQDAARAELATLTSLAASKNILGEGRSYLFYESEGGMGVDSFGTVDAEYKSYHYLFVNGNLLFQASLFRTDGILDEDNLKTYTEAITDKNNIKSILVETVEGTFTVLGVLFPPTDADYNLNSESYSFELGSFYTLPTHGTLSMEVYIGNSAGAVGTLLDSSGLGSAEEGDLYLYVDEDGRLLAGIYAPQFDADCEQQEGWFRLSSTEALSSYEWNTVELHYGVGGFQVDLNGETVGTCSVSQARSARPLYLGDFPDDTLDESMLGYVTNFTATPSTTDTGRTWDSVLTEQLFLDLANTDPDLPVFEFLKEAGVFLGSNGMLYPDEVLNRAEMVKILLKAFEETVIVGVEVPFWDVPSDAWYLKYLSTAYNIGMIEGHSDGTFLPGHSINRAEFFTMLERVSGQKVSYADSFLDVDGEDWFSKGAAYASSKGLIGNLFFYPEKTLTRREAASFLYELLK